MVFVAGSSMMVTMGGIVGSRLAPLPALATLPVSLAVVGTALGTLPATRLMQQFGRRAGFTAAALLAVCASALAFWGLHSQWFWLYCAGTAMTGFCLAFSHQAGQAVSVILLGSVGGAVIGPELVARSDSLLPGRGFEGAIAAAGCLFALAAALLQGLRIPRPTPQHETSHEGARSLAALAREPLFLLAIAAGVIGQGVMTFIMTATPVSMHVVDGHSLAATAAVIRAHVLAMYLPSLASGLLISQFGERALIAMGVAAYLIALSIGLSGQAVMHYGIALVLLGIGWNFMFVGGTTLLVKTYRPNERFLAQGVNEAAVFGTSALGSLLAGTLLTSIGWSAVMLSTLPMILAIGLAVWLLRRRPFPVLT
jgi:MFS family permease